MYRVTSGLSSRPEAPEGTPAGVPGGTSGRPAGQAASFPTRMGSGPLTVSGLKFFTKRLECSLLSRREFL